MARVIGVRFRDNGKIYYFASEQFEVEVGQNVIVETARGVEYASNISKKILLLIGKVTKNNLTTYLMPLLK